MALLVGPRNCERETGLPWRHVRDHARALGVSPIVLGRKMAFAAEPLLQALGRTATTPESDEPTPTDPAAVVRARLGVRRRDG